MNYSFSKDYHIEAVKLINEMLLNDGFSLKCSLEEHDGYFYNIDNPHKADEFLAIYFDFENAILYYAFDHIHFLDRSSFSANENAQEFYINIRQFLTDEYFTYVMLDKKGNPYIGGSHSAIDKQEILNIFFKGSYASNCSRLIIKSWTGILDEVIFK